MLEHEVTNARRFRAGAGNIQHLGGDIDRMGGVAELRCLNHHQSGPAAEIGHDLVSAKIEAFEQRTVLGRIAALPRVIGRDLGRVVEIHADLLQIDIIPIRSLHRPPPEEEG